MTRAWRLAIALGLALAAGLALHRALTGAPTPAPRAEPPAPRPNILLVVWDTVRADRMSLYGAARATTPRLDAWAAGARVFDDVLSTAHSTLPSHASLFTGLLPAQHGTSYRHGRLDDRHETLAERLSAAGYRTFLWSSNPHVAAELNFDQGFDAVAHPWDAERRAQALRIVRRKVASDTGTGMQAVVASDEANTWAIKAAGELAIPALSRWLRESDARKPFFAFVNLMEAHRQYVPPRELRARFLSEPEVARSYAMDNSWPSIWSYTFGLREYSDADLAVTAGVYDACLLELDGIFDRMLAALRRSGALDDTVVVLTSDHGEHLGEHHMLDHQFTLYEPVLRVPLIVHYPPGFPAGRSAAPVMTFDVFPTLLELAGLPVPEGVEARSLTRPAAARTRLAEHPASIMGPINLVREHHPDWDPTPWLSPMCALYEGPHKLLWRRDGRVAAYDLSRDPRERDDLSAREPALTARMRARLQQYFARLPRPSDAAPETVPELSAEQRERLRALGYAP